MAKVKAKAKTPAKKKSNHLSEVLNAVTQKRECNYNPKEVSAWVLSLFLSEDPELIEIVNKINEYHFSLDDRLIFKYYVSKVPCKKRYIKFTKKTKEAKENDEQIKFLMETYGVSKREAQLSVGKG
jgi:hypothetical protein